MYIQFILLNFTNSPIDATYASILVLYDLFTFFSLEVVTLKFLLFNVLKVPNKLIFIGMCRYILIPY